MKTRECIPMLEGFTEIPAQALWQWFEDMINKYPNSRMKDHLLSVWGLLTEDDMDSLAIWGTENGWW